MDENFCYIRVLIKKDDLTDHPFEQNLKAVLNHVFSDFFFSFFDLFNSFFSRF